MASFYDLTTVQLKQAVHLREQIETLQGKLDALLGGSSAPKKKVGSSPAGKQKRTMSAESRAKMAAGQKARWAKINGELTTKAAPSKVSVKAVPKKKRVMSPEAKEKIGAAMKARWDAKKADKKE